MRTNHALPAILSLFLISLTASQTSTAAMPDKNAVLSPAAEAALKDKLQTIFNTACSKDEFSGTYLVAKNGKIISEAACGEASMCF